MTTYIVKDKYGREVFRTMNASCSKAALGEAFQVKIGSTSTLMLAAGYTVEEAVEMIEVPVEDLERATASLGFVPNDAFAALRRLRALVEKHRSGK